MQATAQARTPMSQWVELLSLRGAILGIQITSNAADEENSNNVGKNNRD